MGVKVTQQFAMRAGLGVYRSIMGDPVFIRPNIFLMRKLIRIHFHAMQEGREKPYQAPKVFSRPSRTRPTLFLFP
jgi:hypothetical protein